MLYVLVMVGLIVGMDVLFFRHLFWARLITNVGIVVVFATFYMTVLKRRGPQSRDRDRGDPT